MAGDAMQQYQDYLVPLTQALDGLGRVARHLHPIGYRHQLDRVGDFRSNLRAIRDMGDWETPFSALRPLLDAAASEALAAYEGLYKAAEPPEDMMRAYRALRHFPRALEALYPLAGIVPPLNRFFLDAFERENADLQKRLMRQPPTPDTGVLCLGDDPDARNTVWAYVPEAYDPEMPAPLVVALHGGSGNGRAFLWSWLRAARSRGAIVVAPTSQGQTWAIQGPDGDTPRLGQLVSFVRSKWTVDTSRILLTGMSDGGTFTYTSGLLAESPFTHLAPVAAAFHPMLAAMADGERMQGLPVHIIHGAHDWMFPAQMADEACEHLSRAGADVTYRRLEDLSHTYGADLSTIILDWLLA
jgi:phospholipase/carboxylesterase